MWEIQWTEQYDRRIKHYRKKRPREVAAVEANLHRFHQALQGGLPPNSRTFGYLHPEGNGVFAIDQSGGGKKGGKLTQFRLYVYPDDESKTLYLITLGEKVTQPSDVKYSHSCVADIKNARKTTNQQPPQPQETQPHGPDEQSHSPAELTEDTSKEVQ